MAFLRTAAHALLTLSLVGRTVTPVAAIDLDPTNSDSIKSAAAIVAKDLMGYYATGSTGAVISGIPGLLTYPPYYWWEAGAMFGQMVEYWYYTGDDTYNDIVSAGMQFQVGNARDFMPANQSKDEGNDDQLFWAFTVMSATEVGFPNPPADKPQWLALAQSVFNQLTTRWDTSLCAGGLPWQIYTWNQGYNYKNTAANGGLFQLGARLAKYTGNTTYADWANKAYDWLASSPLITADMQVYDGSNSLKNCTDVDRLQWSYNYGIMIGGAAYMYNYTNGSQIWETRLTGFLQHAESVFFPTAYGSQTMVEVACEVTQKCDVDQWSFKAYLSRWMAISAQIAPFTAAKITPLLQASAKAAAKQCNGGTDGTECGSRWFQDTCDGNVGVGQSMSALSVINANLIASAKAPLSADTGGTSKGNPAAGTGGNEGSVLPVAGRRVVGRPRCDSCVSVVVIAALGS
ncbi:mannan endo-1,6-alpha-mannosidase [Mytilinidion resinicola]|uniref:Mannan endo-1,6-alpha-mannosidase n=1 Tax=Mytilinidion resinicola TaxID=574789 RepID=A0A6A6YEE7_9PEZI|nr:mannan endo-1,6-alpha-mannosidase [Mytilinidion resinicola]KAF2807192.1 mannan endo-1,6-alpha-mannosidase [Mytilinidion resinicola]